MSWAARFLYAWRNADHILVDDCLALSAKLAILERERNHAWGELNRRTAVAPVQAPPEALPCRRIPVHEAGLAPTAVCELVTTLHGQLASAYRTLEAYDDAEADVLLTLRPIPLDELLALLDGAYVGAAESTKS